MRRMVPDKEITPVEIVGIDEPFFCDFCGEKAICISGTRTYGIDETRPDKLGPELNNDAGICYNCATQAASLLMTHKRRLPDGQIDV